MTLVSEVFSFVWELVWGRWGMAVRWYCFAALYAGRDTRGDAWWLLDVFVAWLVTLSIPHFAIAITGLESGRSFLAFLRQYPDLRLKEVEVPADATWRHRFLLESLAPKAYSELRGARKLRFVVIESPVGLKLMSFINAYGTSIIVGKVPPQTAAKPIEKFNLYHELGHCSFYGMELWARRLIMPISSLSAAVLVSVTEWRTHYAVAAGTLLSVLLSWVYWVRRYEYIEDWADRFAMVKLCEEDPDTALKAGTYWLRVWKRELQNASNRRFELQTRIRSMQHCLREAQRLKEGKFVAGLSANPGRVMVLPDWMVVALSTWAGFHTRSGDYKTGVALALAIELLMLITARIWGITSLRTVQSNIDELFKARLSYSFPMPTEPKTIERVLLRVAPDDCENLGSLVPTIVESADRGVDRNAFEESMRTDVEAAHQDYVSIATFVFELAGFIKTCFDFYDIYEKAHGSIPSKADLLADPTIAEQASSSPEAAEVPGAVVEERDPGKHQAPSSIQV